ncbi:HAD-superfamily hydrolase [Spinellus fusiger]|nr:HAD-superfamily hydrolase [Spinellus fusiger]
MFRRILFHHKQSPLKVSTRGYSNQQDERQFVDYIRQKYNESKKNYMAATTSNSNSTLPFYPMHTQQWHSAGQDHHTKQWTDKKHGVSSLDVTSPNEVFINNELHLSHIDVYGFDYDYTLANYTDTLSQTIYDILKGIMVDVLRYPKQIKDFHFDPSFAIRGLHYDMNKGWLMKIDNMANIQLSTVYAGREQVHDVEEVIRLHQGTHISPSYLKLNMFQLNDLFSTPLACLLSDILQYFKESITSFHPRYVSDDVMHAASILHTSSSRSAYEIGGPLHEAIVKQIPAYLDKAPHLVGLLEHLRSNGKKTFLLTNSSLPFISEGMNYLTSTKNWRELFDVVIVSARKPDFYRLRLPFRRTCEPTWSSVDRFEPGEVYEGGNLIDFTRMTGWTGQRVLYFGDHLFSDLIDPILQKGWHTGAIVHELKQEIEARNTPSYRHTLSWLLRLEYILNEAQSYRQVLHNSEINTMVDQWQEERRQARLKLKTSFNKSFGSVFRTYQNPSYFASKIQKFADIYMSNVTCLKDVPLDYVFYPNRTYLPHERLVETMVDTGKPGGSFY